jgi:hypothetical protein
MIPFIFNFFFKRKYNNLWSIIKFY